MADQVPGAEVCINETGDEADDPIEILDVISARAFLTALYRHNNIITTVQLGPGQFAQGILVDRDPDGFQASVTDGVKTWKGRIVR